MKVDNYLEGLKNTVACQYDEEYTFFKEKFKCFPSTLRINIPEKDICNLYKDTHLSEEYQRDNIYKNNINKLLKDSNYEILYNESSYVVEDNKSFIYNYNSVYLLEDQEMFICVNSEAIKIIYNSLKENKLLDKINQFFTNLINKSLKKDNRYKIQYLISQDNELRLYEKDVKYKSKFTENINDLYSFNTDDIINKIDKKENGIFIMRGSPGTGKTSFIKYLSYVNRERPFIYIPNSLISGLDNPSFLSLLMKCQDGIFILEDAEEFITNNGSYRSPGLATLLNIADGFIGDTLNITFIVTYNQIDSNKGIDKALLRDGRLLGEYEFNSLNVDQTYNLLNKLYKDLVTKKEEISSMTLAEIFNFKNKVGRVEKKEDSFYML